MPSGRKSSPASTAELGKGSSGLGEGKHAGTGTGLEPRFERVVADPLADHRRKLRHRRGDRRGVGGGGRLHRLAQRPGGSDRDRRRRRRRLDHSHHAHGAQEKISRLPHRAAAARRRDMNWVLVKKIVGAMLALAGSNFLFQQGGTREMIIGTALLAAGAVIFIWAARG